MSACMSVCQSDEDYETYDTILELDEILNLDSDAERTAYIHVINHFYPRDAMLARVIEIATCPSVRPSVTRRYCVKTKKASGMISSPSGSPKTLVF